MSKYRELMEAKGFELIGAQRLTYILSADRWKRGPVEIQVAGYPCFWRPKDFTCEYYAIEGVTIAMVRTDPEFRRQGLARAAFRDVLNITKSVGVRRITIEIAPQKEGKKKAVTTDEILGTWYKSEGFVDQKDAPPNRALIWEAPKV
jgi:GNAT superfamily N-acetyltransferase